MHCNHVKLLIDKPISESDFPKSQVDLYNFLLVRFAQVEKVTLQEMMSAMGCQTPMPIRCRLNHLQERGALQLVDCPCVV
jgi:hypothetical protein